MTPIVADKAHGGGKLVALEGNINTITTQLRLLPHSHMILILAPLDHYLSEDHKREPFEARAFVRDVHIALTRRNEVARSFLRSSQSKLAFLNGGSVSARAICVAKISQRLTYGNFAEAATIFHDIVKDGVAGLFGGTKSSSPSSKSTPIPEPAKVTARPRAKLPKKLDLRSTKSAATLSGKDLPECEIDMEGNGTSGARNLRRSMADSGPQIIHIPGESRTITSRRSMRESQHGSDIVTTVVSIPSEPRTSQINGTRCRMSQYSGTFGPRPSSSSKPSFSVPRSRYSTQPTTDIDEDEDYFEYISQDDDNLFSSPNVVYGEACVVDMQSALPTPTTPSWTKSIGDLLLQDDPKTSLYFKHAASTSDLRSSFNIPRRSFMKDSTFEQLPKAAFVKASKTTIRRSLTPNTPNFRDSIRSNSKGVSHAFKGCGTELEEEDLDLTKPVFDIAEDLIIHFTDNSPIEISRSISEYRSGNFPISSPLLPRPLPTPPTTAPMATESLNSGQSVNQWRLKTHSDCPKSIEADSYFSQSPVQEEIERQKAFNRPLSTSASTTFSINKGTAYKFCEFPGAYSNKSIDIQNEFRSFLNFHFPEEAKALNQYQNSVMFESGPFWKDMFSNGSSTSCEGPDVDQIIAVGCEKGISDVFSSQLLRQVENIGIKKSGESRSGRLDLRFLIASAMQTFMSQPLVARKDLDPMTDPRLLADLIVPHLETYLATNSMVRFLILSFPFDQIATVIALRSLLGSDLVKVAGVLDTLSSDPPSFAKPPLPKFHSSHHSFDAAVATDLLKRTEYPQRYPLKSSLDALRDADPETILKRSSSSFSLFIKADYHLPSTASGSEIQNFLILIRKNMVERFSWYSIEQVFLRPLPIPSQTIIMKDASTTTEELLRADSDTDMSQFIAEQNSFITSSLYDSDLLDAEILRLPTHLSTRPSYFPASSRATSRSISPAPATPPRSSSYSAGGSTIRHIPIAIERHSISRDTIRPHDRIFPPPQTQTQTHIQEQQQEAIYTYAHSTTSSTSVPHLDRTHSDEISVDTSEVDLEIEVDSEDDAYDRMVMGCYSPMGAKRRSTFLQARFGAYGGGGGGSAKGEVKARAKGNSRKALKWLGLA